MLNTDKTHYLGFQNVNVTTYALGVEITTHAHYLLSLWKHDKLSSGKVVYTTWTIILNAHPTYFLISTKSPAPRAAPLHRRLEFCRQMTETMMTVKVMMMVEQNIMMIEVVTKKKKKTPLSKSQSQNQIITITIKWPINHTVLEWKYTKETCTRFSTLEYSWGLFHSFYPHYHPLQGHLTVHVQYD